MMTKNRVVAAFVCSLIFILHTKSSHGWWPFSTAPAEETPVPGEPVDDDGHKIQQVPAKFEVSTAEQKFLAEAEKYLDMSPLEKCQHSVISQLRSSCGEMTDEEVGKLSVHLLNCQSQAEKRSLYSCTKSMTLADCTSPMDATTWNAYHIITNRARSVCFSIQQQRFRQQTELAVNKLSESTLKQLQAVHELEDSHQMIKDFTQESFQSFQENQKLLSQQQEEVMSTHVSLSDHIGENLLQLTEEKTLIQSGQVLLAGMTEQIKKQLDEASEALEKQSEDTQEGHKVIVGDIKTVKENIDQVWHRVDEGTAELLSLMATMATQYENTLQNLQLINSSISSMMAVVDSMNSALTTNLDSIVNWMGGAKEGLHVLTTLAVHAAFLFLAILCVLFVKAPALTRVALLVMVSVNALAEIKFHCSLSVSSMAAMQALLLIGNWSYYWFGTVRLSSPLAAPHHPTNQIIFPNGSQYSYTEDQRASSPHTGGNDSWDDDKVVMPSKMPETLACTPTKSSCFLGSPSPCSTPLRRASLFKCKARTRSGLQCKLSATPGNFTCKRHSDFFSS